MASRALSGALLAVCFFVSEIPMYASKLTAACCVGARPGSSKGSKSNETAILLFAVAIQAGLFSECHSRGAVCNLQIHQRNFRGAHPSSHSGWRYTLGEVRRQDERLAILVIFCRGKGASSASCYRGGGLRFTQDAAAWHVAIDRRELPSHRQTGRYLLRSISHSRADP